MRCVVDHRALPLTCPENRASCMILTCPQCATRYPLEAKPVPPEGQKVRCAKCGRRWHQTAAGDEPAAGLAGTPLSGLKNDVPKHRSDRTLESYMPPERTPRKIPLVPTWILVVLAAAGAWGLTRERSATLRDGPINFGAVAYSRDMRDGRPVLIVRGSIVNSGSRAQSVPEVEAVLADAYGRPVAQWTFQPDPRQLAAGEEASFSTEKLKPPESAQSLALHLKRR